MNLSEMCQMIANELLRVLVLDEGSPGHLAQSEGILQILENQGIEIEYEMISVDNHLPGIFRGLMRWIMSFSSAKFCRFFLIFCSRIEKLPDLVPDLIISSGGKSVFASHTLKQRYGAYNLYVGMPEPFPDIWFDLIVSPVKRPYRVPSIISGLIPNTVTPELVDAAGRVYWQNAYPKSPCWALFIGGNSKSHQFSRSDWQGLVDGINRIGIEQDVRWLITTSRRTPLDVEKLLFDKVDPRVVVEMILYNRQQKKVVKPFISAAERVLVTQDSLTMASEALCSGRPVTLLEPELLKIVPGSYFAEMLECFSKLKGVERIKQSTLVHYRSDFNEDQSVFTPDDMGVELIQVLVSLNILKFK